MSTARDLLKQLIHQCSLPCTDKSDSDRICSVCPNCILAAKVSEFLSTEERQTSSLTREDINQAIGILEYLEAFYKRTTGESVTSIPSRISRSLNALRHAKGSDEAIPCQHNEALKLLVQESHEVEGAHKQFYYAETLGREVINDPCQPAFELVRTLKMHQVTYEEVEWAGLYRRRGAT